MLAGYAIGIATIPKYISQQAALQVSALTGILFSIGIFFTTGYVAITFIALLGLSNALMWPAIFPLAIRGLGRFTKMGAAMLVMGIAGGALVPLLYGTLKDKLHVANGLSFVLCTLPCYGYIYYYAVRGHKATPVLPLAQ
jgi:fucose permease